MLHFLTKAISSDDYVKYSIYFGNDERWKAHRSAMNPHFTSKLESSIDLFRSHAENLVKNIDELNEDNGNKEINLKPLMRCLAIDTISKFFFRVDVNSFKEK